VVVLAPFAGLSIGKYMQAVKRAQAEGVSLLALPRTGLTGE
jgi:hypothetical protein